MLSSSQCQLWVVNVGQLVGWVKGYLILIFQIPRCQSTNYWRVVSILNDCCACAIFFYVRLNMERSAVEEQHVTPLPVALIIEFLYLQMGTKRVTYSGNNVPTQICYTLYMLIIWWFGDPQYCRKFRKFWRKIKK